MFAFSCRFMYSYAIGEPSALRADGSRRSRDDRRNIMPARTGRRWRERIVPRVIRRDHGICHLCDQPGADTADHLVPPGQGGALYALDNLKAAHHNNGLKCNRIRGDRSIAWARAEIRRRHPEHFTPPDDTWTW